MRILYVSQYYPPEMGAPAARVSALARRWAAAGHHVTVLTAFPNHPTGVIPPGYRGRRLQVEEDRGVHVRKRRPHRFQSEPPVQTDQKGAPGQQRH